MKIDATSLNNWKLTIVGLSRDGLILELRDDSSNQYFFNTQNNILKKCPKYYDYIFLNYQNQKDLCEFFLSDIFYYLDEGNIHKHKPFFSKKDPPILEKNIDDIFYSRGILFSDIDFEKERFFIISKCPDSLKSENNHFKTEMLLYNQLIELHPGEFDWLEGMVSRSYPSQTNNALIIGFFDLKGNLIKRIFVQSCFMSDNISCELSMSRNQFLISDADNTLRFDYFSGELIGAYVGNTFTFINDNLIGYWTFFGYGYCNGSNEILDNDLNCIYKFSEDSVSAFSYKINKGRTFDNKYYFLSSFNKDPYNSNLRLFYFSLDNYYVTYFSDAFFKPNERLLGFDQYFILSCYYEGNDLHFRRTHIDDLGFELFSNEITIDENSPGVDNFYYVDLHTKSSTRIAENEFVTKRTRAGELLYKFKYCFEYDVIDELFSLILDSMEEHYHLHDVIIPVPPSKLNRPYQPVLELTKKLSENNFNVDFDGLIKKKVTPELKGISDSVDRKDVLADAFDLVDSRYSGKRILLFDDLFRSGETLNSIARLLKTKGQAKEVDAFTITKTRTNR
jgi:competence protein ComFC